MARARSKIHPPASPLINMLYHHGVEDAIIFLTHKAQSHLGEKKVSSIVGSINEHHDEECRGLIRELCHEVLQQSRDTR